jgi:hypothetical protein
MPDFTEVPAPVERNALGAWAGWFGEGVGGVVDANGEVTQLGSLFVSTGSRAPGGGGASRIFRLDRPDGPWEDDGVPHGAETISKMRSGTDPLTGDARLWAFFETPTPGQTWLISREALPGPGSWRFESVPTEGADVGGGGLGVPLGGLERLLYAGASQNWNDPAQRQGKVFRKETDGSWKLIRAIGPAFGHHPTLMSMIEFDSLGRYWQVWGYGQGSEAGTFVNNVGGTPPNPTDGGSDMAWFVDPGVLEPTASSGAWMYLVASEPTYNTRVFRNIHPPGTSHTNPTGPWEEVHRFELAKQGGHLLHIPRGEAPGELWTIAHDPLEVWFTLDGLKWTRDLTIPPLATGSDPNHLNAIAYYDGSVWIISRDLSRNGLRAWRDKPEKGAKPALSGQII